MGYWAKDGSYVYEDGDLEQMTASNESQSQFFARQQAGKAYAQAYEESEKRRKENERKFEADFREREFEYQRQQAAERAEQFKEMTRIEKERENQRRYGTDFDLRNPHDLSERRARANYWRTKNTWTVLINKINGKSKKFDDLWEAYAKTDSEEEKIRIVEEMEKMFPTTSRAVDKVEYQHTRGR